MRLVVDRDRFVRALPFAFVAILAQGSTAWPPGPANLHYFWISSALLLASGAPMAFLANPPANTWLLAALTYIGSVAFLMLATGGVTAGLGSLLLIPVVGMSLYGRRRDSAVVVTAVMVTLLAISLTTPSIDAATVRRTFIFGAVGAMLSFAVHSLRDRLVDSNHRTTRLLVQAQAMNSAAEQLTSLLDPEAIMKLGEELAAQVASLPSSVAGRATYYRIEMGTAVADGRRWSLDELPSVKEAVTTALPMTTTVSGTHGIWVPVRPDGSLHGVLTLESQNFAPSGDCLDRCVALGHLLELALSNWNGHQRLEQQATQEERRRIARELHDGLAHELAFIASRAKRAAGRAQGETDIRDLVSAADRALDEARRAITILTAVGPQPLAHALTQTAEDLGARLGMSVEVDAAEDVDMPAEVTEHLLRIVREAMTNAANHAQASRVSVHLNHEEGVRLVIQDDGCGFDFSPGTRRTGFGLLSMEERAACVGARFKLDSAPDRGTRIEVAFA